VYDTQAASFHPAQTLSLLPVRFVLASASPRRAELLTAAGFEFDIIPADVDETPAPAELAREYALRVARAKAEYVARQFSDGRIILAADTVVVAGGRLMGKPADAREAHSMLKALSGVAHEVHTAVVVRSRGGQIEEVVTTEVRFNPLSEGEIAWYVSTGEAEGKAGAYAIQGRAARFIEQIVGSWSNVVGLPISTVYRLLSEAGGEEFEAAPNTIDPVEG
jgi:nucleoside triphosphate pyrophosphatase